MNLALGGYTAWTRDTNHTFDASGSVRWVHSLRTGQNLWVGPQASSTAMDVLRGPANTDNGRSTTVGVGVGVAW